MIRRCFSYAILLFRYAGSRSSWSKHEFSVISIFHFPEKERRRIPREVRLRLVLLRKAVRESDKKLI